VQRSIELESGGERMTEAVLASARTDAEADGIAARPGFGPRLVSIPLVCGGILALDVLLVIGASLLAYGLWLSSSAHVTWHIYGFATLSGVLLAVNAFHLAGLYRFGTLLRPFASLRRLAVAWCAVAAVLIAVTFFTKSADDVSRGWAALWFAGGLSLLAMARLGAHGLVKRWVADGRLARRAVIVGSPVMAGEMRSHFAANPEAGVRVLASFDQDLAAVGAAGPAQDLEDCVRARGVDTVILALPVSDETGIARLYHRLRALPVDVRLFPGRIAFGLASRGVTHFGQLPMLKMLDRPLAGWRVAAKEVEDRVLGTAILLLVAPVLLAVAVAVRLDSPGPVFFRQKRRGFNNQLIDVLKFRTMHHDQCDSDASRLTSRDDPRVTRLGAFLRRTSLDELPQFINVVRGEMSIVGPRPHALSAKADGVLYDKAVANYAARHRVKPGITGWAQINGWRGETRTREQILKRVEHDLFYIENWSLWLDLRIIALTALTGFVGRNAY